MIRTKAYTVEVGPARPGEGAPRRNVKAAKGAWVTIPGKPHVRTAYDLLLEGAREFGPRPFMGQRVFIKKTRENHEVATKVNGKTVLEIKEKAFYEMGQYVWSSYAEVEALVHHLASGLLALGRQPKRDMFCIYCRTSPEWLQTALALMSQSIPLVTAYDSLGFEALEKVLKSTKSSGILADRTLLPTLARAVHNLPDLNLVIYRDWDGPLERAEIEAVREIESAGIVVTTFSKLRDIGRENIKAPNPPNHRDTACIMYTSGSGGSPKGVVLSHGNLIAGVVGTTGNLTRASVKKDDVFMAVLPCAHIFELNCELSSLCWGVALGYGTPATLSDVNMRNCVGDMRELRPTILAGTPSIWELLKKSVLASVREQPELTQKIFWQAFNMAATLHSWGLGMPFLDSILFRKIRRVTGGRLRRGLSGGASLARDTRIFTAAVIAPCVMGYGATETNAMGCIMPDDHIEHESSGELVPSVTAKLVDFPEAGYFASNGQGEVYLRGPCVSQGYFQDDEETAKSFTKDGWFKTGDIAEWTSLGCLRIIDRSKNLVKNLNGDHIALEKLETVYKSNHYVKNVCVVADGEHIKPIAIIQPFEPSVRTLCNELNLEYSPAAYRNTAVYSTILDSVKFTAARYRLNSHEVLGALVFGLEEWTPESGMTSPTFKLKRPVLLKAFETDIARAFSDTDFRERVQIPDAIEGSGRPGTLPHLKSSEPQLVGATFPKFRFWGHGKANKPVQASAHERNTSTTSSRRFSFSDLRPMTTKHHQGQSSLHFSTHKGVAVIPSERSMRTTRSTADLRAPPRFKSPSPPSPSGPKISLRSTSLTQHAGVAVKPFVKARHGQGPPPTQPPPARPSSRPPPALAQLEDLGRGSMESGEYMSVLDNIESDSTDYSDIEIGKGELLSPRALPPSAHQEKAIAVSVPGIRTLNGIQSWI